MAPGDFTALSRTAYIHYVQGQYDKAKTEYRKALAAYPASVEMHAGLGGSLLKRGRYKEARAQFENVLAVAPDHASAKEGMSLIP